jgi:nucleotide sugar dehydrogenase
MTAYNNKYFGVVGLGNIGYSTMIHYSAKNINVIGYDIANSRVKEVNEGTVSIPGMQNWVDHDIGQLRREGLYKATCLKEEFVSFSPEVIFIAVPTERKGHPSPDFIADTFRWLFSMKKDNRLSSQVFIVESTMAPGTADKVILPMAEEFGLVMGKDVFLGISPRRDWFKEAGKTVKDMERVYGGVTTECTQRTKEYLSIICEKLFVASSYRVAELTKCLENTFRFIEISLANQFALAFPDIDVKETLELAATKWNMDYYHPSMKVGGHCVPVAPRYVMTGAKKPEYLSIVDAALNSENKIITRTTELLKLFNLRKVALLGLGYRANLKISVFSPCVELAKHLIQEGFTVKISDPLFSNEEIERECGIAGSSLEDCLDGATALVIISAHDEFIRQKQSITSSSTIEFVIDNSGAGMSWDWDRKVSYFHIGDGKLLNIP